MNTNNYAQGTIEIEGLRLYGYHGVFEQETAVGNTFEVSVILRYPALYAMRTDRIDLAINYAQVVETIKQEMEIPSKLLENIAYRIQLALLKRFPEITSGRITIYKLNPPISEEIDKVGFTFCW